MTVIKWRDSYNTGVDQFDRDHHKIVELIDTMFVAIRDKAGKEVTQSACNDVLSYAEYHFNNEEKAMKAADYPDIAEHIAEHERLTAEAKKLQTIIAGSFPEGANEFYHFLREWLINHIQVCDKKYAPYLSRVTGS
jgi:hemerythrin